MGLSQLAVVECIMCGYFRNKAFIETVEGRKREENNLQPAAESIKINEMQSTCVYAE